MSNISLFQCPPRVRTSNQEAVWKVEENVDEDISTEHTRKRDYVRTQPPVSYFSPIVLSGSETRPEQPL